MARAVENALAFLSRLLVHATALCLAAMMLHVFADVVLKYLANNPVPGTAEVVAHYYMVAAVFLPLPFVEIRNSAISVDLFYNFFGAWPRWVMLVLAYAGQTVFFALLAYQSSLDAWASFGIGEYVMSQVRVTVWPAAFFLPIGFGVACLVSLLRIFQLFTRKDWEDLCGHVDGDADDLTSREPV